jgi:hypothetical protein
MPTQMHPPVLSVFPAFDWHGWRTMLTLRPTPRRAASAEQSFPWLVPKNGLGARGKVNGDADVREREPLSVGSGFRAQGSKQGRACRGLSDWDAVFDLSSVIGTSVAQIDATYGHLAPDVRLDALACGPR